MKLLREISALVILALALTMCAKKEVIEEDALITPDGQSNTQLEVSAGEAEPTSPGLEVIYFDFDSYVIRPDAASTLDNNIQWLNNNPGKTIQIEGHCDERGTTEYNLALGERRANATKNYMVRKGIDPSRLSIISYGEERPAESGHNESAWSRNRRSEFIALN